MEQAYDRLGDRAPETPSLEHEFDERDRQEQLQRGEFDELKKRLGENES